jgi:flap endonuclease-1
MGVNLKGIVTKKDVTFDALKGKVLAIDSYNHLYQYLTTIRAKDGKPLTDSAGRITSHLMGLFTRTANLMQKNINLIFVFDGEPPRLKWTEQQRRKEVKLEAEKLYKAAEKKGDIDLMRKYAARFAKLTPEMVEEAKELIAAFGLPVVQAPSEGDAQIACLVKNKDAYAAVSQDFDSLLHGTPRLLRNISIVGRRKKAGTLSYETIEPEIIILKENLKRLGITHQQLIAVALLIGTDYNPGGIKGTGPKNALKLVKKFKSDFNALFKEVNWDGFFDFSWREAFDLIKNLPVTDKYELKWAALDKEKIIKLLCEKHNFSEERVTKIVSALTKIRTQKEQKGLGEFV